MIIPPFHASVPTGVGFSRQACVSGFLLAWLIGCGGLGFLLGSKCSVSLLGMGHRQGTTARVKTCLLLLWGRCREQQTALHTVLLQDIHCRAQAPIVPLEVFVTPVSLE